MKKFFNASGPCNAKKHYMVDIDSRIQKIHTLIDNERYFILHAPRQTGKTTCMKYLVDKLNHEQDIKESALVLENFTREQVSDLFHQHTTATGQQFDIKALDHISYKECLISAIARTA